MNVRGVIFDLDGTLVDSECVNIEAALLTFSQELRICLAYDEISFIPGKSSLDCVPALLARRGIPQERCMEIVAKYRENYDILWDKKAGLMPCAMEVIR